MSYKEKVLELIEMKCPFCGNDDTKVIDTRNMSENNSIRRRRMCEKCSKRFTTFERMEETPLIVKKSNNTRESFSRNKLLKGIMISCNKRIVSMEQMEAIVDYVENFAFSKNGNEIESKEIGNIVMNKLKDIDEVAYVRFASVYRQFKDIDSFMSELALMLKERK